MAFASGSRVQMAYVPEVTFGTTPVTPQMILFPMQSTTLDLSKDIFNDPTILSDRMERYERHGNQTVGGNVQFTLQHSQWDDFLEAALGGTWTADVLKIGQTERSFTIEQGFLDLPQYRRFTGVRVNTFEINVVPNAIVTGTFGLIGAGMTTSSTALDSTPTAVLDKQPMSHIGGTITIAGGAVVCTSATINVNNQMSAAYGIGSSMARDVKWSESVVTGSATFYFEDLTQYNRFLNETTAEIVLTLSDGTDTLTFTLPKVKFNGGTIPVPNSGTLFVTVPFKALYDSVSGTTISITRS